MDHSYAKQKLSLLVRDIANYTDDEFRRQMARIVSGTTGQDILDDCHTIKAERHSILAELQKANATILDLQRNPPKLAKEFLAEIKAEAGRAGFVAGAEVWCDCGVESQCKADCLIGIEADADRYAIKIRNTGTWLKDSNVNGGKRQGDAE